MLQSKIIYKFFSYRTGRFISLPFLCKDFKHQTNHCPFFISETLFVCFVLSSFKDLDLSINSM